MGMSRPAKRPIDLVKPIRIPLPPNALRYPVTPGSLTGDFSGILERYFDAGDVPGVAPPNLPLVGRIEAPDIAAVSASAL